MSGRITRITRNRTHCVHNCLRLPERHALLKTRLRAAMVVLAVVMAVVFVVGVVMVVLVVVVVLVVITQGV